MAQVLPALLIALILEIALIISSLGKILERAENAESAQGETSRERRDDLQEFATNIILLARQWMKAGAVISALFLVGELAAITALSFGWFNGWMFSLTIAPFVILVALIAMLPIIRLHVGSN
ncbi:hypothetical protein [Actinomadura rudentiformis]|uniref:Uncharacterized protein n=1 Tax=Actinomadura rudentiformis TaxID=359158 RepID=A0A6H9YU02_9ACTN|nr:hypothetical protein [Actinomadura rudentiformis]KAB2346974.1 hypothetical protein F8566_22595 [Actinomadura rudentiformis]